MNIAEKVSQFVLFSQCCNTRNCQVVDYGKKAMFYM